MLAAVVRGVTPGSPAHQEGRYNVFQREVSLPLHLCFMPYAET